MKKIIFIILLLSVYSFGQNRLVRQSDLSDSLDAIRTLIGTGGVPLPDSIVYTSEIVGKFNTADTSAFVSDALLSASLAYKLDKSDSATGYVTPSDAKTVIGDSLNARMGAILDIDDLSVVKDYEPIMPDSSIILYSGGTWQIWDLGSALQSIEAGVPTLPDSIVYTSEIVGKFNTADTSAFVSDALLSASLSYKQDKMGTDDNYVTDAEKIVIGNTSGTNSGDNATNSQYSGLASSKQNLLVSGSNIKTINSQSLLGSGNILIEAGTDSDAVRDLALAEITTKIDTMASDTSVYSLSEIELALNNLQGGTATQVLTKTNGDSLNYSWQDATGGTTDTTFIYQRITALEDSVDDLRSTLNTLIDLMTAHGLVILDTIPPSAPTSLVATADNDTAKIRLTWIDPANSDLDSIRIYRAVIADTTAYTYLANVDEGVQAYTNTGLSETTAYWYKIRAVDDSSNISNYSNRDSSLTFTSGGSAGFVVDGLQIYFNDSTLANGSQDTLYNTADNRATWVHNTTASFEPEKTDTGLVFDGDDELNETPCFANILSGACTIEMVCQIVDTSTSQVLFALRNTTPTIFQMNITGGKITASAYYGGSEVDVHNYYATPIRNLMSHIVITWDGSTTTNMYINGSAVADVGNTYGDYAEDNRMSLGGYNGSYEVTANTVIRLVRVYNKVLSGSEVTQNYNSSNVQDLID